MPYNLIDERWIPVRRASGKLDCIAPWEIGDSNDPPVAIESPRADFDGALLEFLIGLVQTTSAPETRSEWEADYDSPPAPSALQARFTKVRDAFFPDGDGPRFMQDAALALQKKSEVWPIGALLIDRNGETTLVEKPRLFAKPGLFEELSFPAAAMALLTLQTYAPSGGRGHLTSLRGGGPLTTVIDDGSLWRCVWNNVLTQEAFHTLPGKPGLKSTEAQFPWMAPSIKKEEGKPTTPDEIHPAQYFWALPRRIRLCFENKLGMCAITGMKDVPVVNGYLTAPYGVNYKGAFRHPLTPYTVIKADAPPNPKKPGAEGLAYRDWPLLAVGNERQHPAQVVHAFIQDERFRKTTSRRLRAFGYATDKAKTLRWVSSTTPLVPIDTSLASAFSGEVQKFVTASEEVRSLLFKQVKAAWKDGKWTLPGSSSKWLEQRLYPAFWFLTEQGFFQAVHACQSSLEQGDRPALDAAKTVWLRELHTGALDVFDQFAPAAVEFALPSLHRVVAARERLGTHTHPSAIAVRKAIGLHEDTVEKPKTSKRRKAAR